MGIRTSNIHNKDKKRGLYYETKAYERKNTCIKKEKRRTRQKSVFDYNFLYEDATVFLERKKEIFKMILGRSETSSQKSLND